MSRKIKQVLFLCICTLMLLCLCACDDVKVKTDMTVDDSFAGTRVMSVDIKQSDISSVDVFGFFTPKPSEIAEVIENACPDELSVDTTDNGKDVTLVFELTFKNKAEYEKKVAALLKRSPNIVFEAASDDVFYAGITLSEDFASSDLFGWAEEALKSKYPKYADKISFSGNTNGSTVVIYGDSHRETTANINVRPVRITFERLIIKTVRYSEDDYSRTISFIISEDMLSAVGQDRLTKQFLSPLTSGVSGFAKGGWNADASSYDIVMESGSLEELKQLTAAVFEGSSTEYNANEAQSAFSESGMLSEKLVFSGMPCNAAGTANVTLEYSAGDDTDFLGDNIQENALLSNNNKTLTLKADGVTEVNAMVESVTRYTVESIKVETNISMTESYTVSVVLGFPEKSSRAAAARAEAFLSEEYKGSGIKVKSQQLGTASGVSKVSAADAYAIGNSENDNVYALIITASGTAEHISDCFTKAFGDGNCLNVDGGNKLSLYRNSDIKHSINISTLTDMAKYAGNISYAFSGTMTRISGAEWDDAVGMTHDVVLGNGRKNNFTADGITSGSFTVNYQFSRINYIFVILVGVVAVALLGILMVGANTAGRAVINGRRKKKEDTAIEAVKTVALANIPEDKRGELTELPAELIGRPTVVIEPRSDDGLNEDDDEPEGLVLFASTLKILLVAVCVLFFFPFFNVQRTGGLSLLNNDASISGWNLFFGKTIFDVEMLPSRMAIIALAIPVIMLVLLLARKVLPRLILPLVVSASSLFQIFYMMKLPESVEKTLDTIAAQLSGQYVSSPEAQWGYTYSIVIYALLAIGGILLLFGDLGFVLNKRRKEKDKQ